MSSRNISGGQINEAKVHKVVQGTANRLYDLREVSWSG